MNSGDNSEYKLTVDLNVDINNLYREEAFTDLKVASIRVLTPVKQDGSEDMTRDILYVGHTQLMTPQGPLPIQSMLNGETLEEAIKDFPITMRKSMDNLIEDFKRMQKEEAERNQSRIISPR